VTLDHAITAFSLLLAVWGIYLTRVQTFGAKEVDSKSLIDELTRLQRLIEPLKKNRSPEI